MGAPKQKWTPEEEAALKAGIKKHGAGRWRTILKDPEFSDVLCLRSNVDLKDKWRNMNVTATGLGSRDKGRMILKKNRHLPENDDDSMNLTILDAILDDEVKGVMPLVVHSEQQKFSATKKSMTRLDNAILEAIKKLNEPKGSHKTAIATYIEDDYYPPPDFKRLLSLRLKALTCSGKLIKVKRRYRIAPGSVPSGGRKINLLLLEGKQEPSRVEKVGSTVTIKSDIDAELAQMRNMTPKEAAVFAAAAVAEAEAVMAQAEAAAREAEAAEAEAEAAKAFAEAASLTLKNRMTNKFVSRA